MADDEWRFAVDDVGDTEGSRGNDPDDERASMRTDDADEPDGTKAPDERLPLEPGSPSLENALFVLLGVFVTLFVIARVATLVAG